MNDPFINSQIAGYRVERLLGRGGMASIYFAWDTQNDRPVALKVLDERHSGAPSYIQRFINEAQAIASWQHPNIVQVYEAGEDQGIYFYAMEFIRGLDLAQLLRQYQDAKQLLPYGEVLRIGWAVAAALDYAHNRGIVHRDVKPSNVLISVDGRVLLSDFGLVMDLNRGTLGETFGSPHYIAPEQARSSAGAVPQSDVYSLAVMLYEMLIGTTPFDDPSPTTLALKHLTEAPPQPRALNPRIASPVEAVLLRGLQKTPRERYASGRELLSALDRSLSVEIGTQVDPNTPLPLPPEVERFKTTRHLPGSQPVARPVPAASVMAQNQQAGGSLGQRPAVRPVPSYSGQPQTGTRPIYENVGTAGYGQAGTGSVPPAAPPAAPTQRSSGRGWGMGCAGLLLATVLLAGALGAALAFSNGGLRLPLVAVTTPTEQPGAVEDPATATPEPSFTFTPSLTFTTTPPPPTETATPQPTLTFTPVPPTPTVVPPTETLPPPPPTETLEPTPEPARQFAIFHYSDEGIFVVNTSETALALAPLALWGDEVELEGEEWELEFLQPDECVIAWERNGRVRMPEDLECDPVGEVLERQGRDRFWQRTINIYYNDALIDECRTRDEFCEIEIP